MTELRKIVRRKGTVPVWELASDHLVAELRPGDVFALRQARRRQWYSATFAELFNVMVAIAVNQRNRAVRKRAKELADAGYSKRRATAMARHEVDAEARKANKA